MEWRYLDFMQNIDSFDDERDITTFIACDEFKDLESYKWLAIKKGCVYEVI